MTGISLLDSAYSKILDTKEKLNDNIGFKDITISNDSIIKNNDSYVDFSRSRCVPIATGYNAIILDNEIIHNMAIINKDKFDSDKLYQLLEFMNVTKTMILIFNDGKVVDTNKIQIQCISDGRVMLMVNDELTNVHILIHNALYVINVLTSDTYYELENKYLNSYMIFKDGHIDYAYPSVGDVALLFNKGFKLHENINYLIDKETHDIQLGYSISSSSSEDVIDCTIFKCGTTKYTSRSAYEYIYQPSEDEETSFVIPSNICCNPPTTSVLMLFYKGFKLEKDINYTLDEENRIVLLGFSISYTSKDRIECIVLKNTIQNMYKEYKYIASSASVSSFTIPSIYYSAANGDSILLFYKGMKLSENVNYTLSGNIVQLGFSLSVANDDFVSYVILRGNAQLHSTYKYTPTSTNITKFNIPSSNFSSYTKKDPFVLQLCGTGTVLNLFMSEMLKCYNIESEKVSTEEYTYYPFTEDVPFVNKEYIYLMQKNTYGFTKSAGYTPLTDGYKTPGDGRYMAIMFYRKYIEGYSDLLNYYNTYKDYMSEYLSNTLPDQILSYSPYIPSITSESSIDDIRAEVITAIKDFPGFYRNYLESFNSINRSKISVKPTTVTFTRNGTAISLIDSSVLQANEPRYTKGTGFDKGIKIDANLTNLIIDPLFENGISKNISDIKWSIPDNTPYVSSEYYINNGVLYHKSIATNGYNTTIISPIIWYVIKSSWNTVQFKMKTVDINTFSLYVKGSAVDDNIGDTLSLQSYLSRTDVLSDGFTLYTYMIPPYTFTGTGYSINIGLTSNSNGKYEITEYYLKEFQVISGDSPIEFYNGTKNTEKLYINTEVMLQRSEGMIEMWVEPRSIPGTVSRMLMQSDLFYLYINHNNSLSVEAKRPSYKLTTGANSILPYNKYLISIGWKNNIINIYINGVKYNVNGTIASYPYIGSSINIGHANGSLFANSIIYDIRFYSKSRAEADILTDYNAKCKLTVDAYTLLKLDFNDNLNIDNRVQYHIPITYKINPSNLMMFNNGLKILPAKIIKNAETYSMYFRLCDIIENTVSIIDTGRDITPYCSGTKLDNTLSFTEISSLINEDDGVKVFQTTKDAISTAINETMFALTTDKDGFIYTTSESGIIRKINPVDLSVLKDSYYSYGNPMRVILIGTDNKIYVAGDRGIIYVFNKSTLKVERSSEYLGGPIINMMQSQSNGYIYYVGGYNSSTIKKFDIVTMTTVCESAEYDGNINCMCIDSNDKIYIGGSSSTFIISTGIFAPLAGDNVSIFYRGLKLSEGDHYTITPRDNIISLKFALSNNTDDKIEYVINKNSTQVQNYYTFIALTTTDSIFTIPSNIYVPNVDTLLLYYNGLKLILNKDYTISSNTVTLNFAISSSNNDKIECIILKNDNPAYTSTIYTYAATTTTATSFIIPTASFLPLSGHTVVLYHHGLKLYEGDNYTLNTANNTVTLNFTISSADNDKIECLIFKYPVNVHSTSEYVASDLQTIYRLESDTLTKEIESASCGGSGIRSLLAHSNGSIYAGILGINIILKLDPVSLSISEHSSMCEGGIINIVEGNDKTIYSGGEQCLIEGSKYYNMYPILKHSPINLTVLDAFTELNTPLHALIKSDNDNTIYIIISNSSIIMKIDEDSMQFFKYPAFEEILDFTNEFNTNSVTITIDDAIYANNNVHMCTQRYNKIINKSYSTSGLIKLPQWASFVPVSNMHTFINGSLLLAETTQMDMDMNIVTVPNQYVFNPFKYSFMHGDTVLAANIDINNTATESLSTWITTEFEMIECNMSIESGQQIIEIIDKSYPFSNKYDMIFIDGKLIDTDDIIVISDYLISINAPSINEVCIMRKSMRNIPYNIEMAGLMDKWSDIVSIMTADEIEQFLDISLNSVADDSYDSRYTEMSARYAYDILYHHIMKNKRMFTLYDIAAIRAYLQDIFIDDGRIIISNMRETGTIPRYIL